jgi:uncharacterized protein YjbI with pentapeptide repeats
MTAIHLFQVNLRNIDLQGSCLAQAYLPYCTFTLANLRAVDFTAAQLGDSNFYGATLTQAQLPQADLNRADLQMAHLQRCNLRRANLGRAAA